MISITSSLILFVFLTSVVAEGADKTTCEIDEGKCLLTIETSTGSLAIDLLPFTSPITSQSSYDGRTYEYMACGHFNFTHNHGCEGGKGCQEDGEVFHPIGSRKGVTCEINHVTYNPRVTYPGIDDIKHQDVKRGAWVEFDCDYRSGLTFIVGDVAREGDTYFYPFHVGGIAACPSSATKKISAKESEQTEH
ncbi:uncharacterized protein LOC142350637 [Convolutriloba macropyga]|uniref:uncharacterized protein LOC142350637 n=1 Tax=Convolutriloba macropyga TaxID=536237 RepID=UPI003F527A84